MIEGLANGRLWLLRGLGAYLRHAPDHPGRWRLIDPAVRLAPALKAVTSPMVIRLRDGTRMEIDGSSQTGRMLYATGEYESETSRLIRSLLNPGDTMIDVGANIGYFSILGARCVGPSGGVLAFEPVPPVRERLQRNIKLNGLDNVTIHAEALSDRSGVIQLFTGPQNDTGLASLRPLPDSTTIHVTQSRLDDLWDPAAPIALVKIDVEGAELTALRGMRACLERYRPHVIVEITDEYLRAMGESASALVVYLLERGYSMYQITHRRLDPIAGPEDLGRCPGQFNALFTTDTDLAAH